MILQLLYKLYMPRLLILWVNLWHKWLTLPIWFGSLPCITNSEIDRDRLNAVTGSLLA